MHEEHENISTEHQNTTIEENQTDEESEAREESNSNKEDKTNEETAAGEDEYLQRLFSGIPLFTSRLVREGEFSFSKRKKVTTPEEVALVLQEYFSRHDREEVLAVLLGAGGTLIGICRLSTGGLTSALVEPRQVFKAAVLGNAASVILAHNHPSGNPEPSKEDLSITRKVAEAGKVMGIPLRDHLIITGRGYTSLAQRGIID